jgi:phosphoinositide-3-kinase, regulatory subunit 4
MGNASYRQTTIGNNQGNQYESITNFMQLDLPKFVKQAMIGNGKFTKSFVMRVDSTQVVVKVYMRLPDEDLQIPTAQLTSLWKTIPTTKYPNLMPYQMWMKSSSRVRVPASPVYLIRQYFHSNLYDRLSTRPFLNELEKLWIIFQLFKCLEICHELNIVHGDIKPENIMCTTSNWVVLTDFGPFKPVMIPDDDPTDFQFYFDAMSRHRCYIAPERFLRKDGNKKTGTGDSTPPPPSLSPATPTPLTPTPGTSSTNSTMPNAQKLRQTGKHTSMALATASLRMTHSPSMDVFSLGCVMAEVRLIHLFIFTYF